MWVPVSSDLPGVDAGLDRGPGGEAAYTYHPNTFTVLTYKPH